MAFEIQALVQDRKKSGGFKFGSQLSFDNTDINKQHKTYIALLLLKKEMFYTYFNKYKINSRWEYHKQ